MTASLPPDMSLAEVMTVLAAIDGVGCRYWLEGGWGVDALVGQQTRPHRDLDVDFDATYEDAVVAAVEALGYAIHTDWRPNRIELIAPGRGWVDLHPLLIAADGSARQVTPDGAYYPDFPRSYYTVGQLAGRPVPCVTGEAQRVFREGYEHRPIDRHDLEVLNRFQHR